MNLERMRIGTFNLYNLNKPGIAVYSDKDGWSEQEYARKIQWTAHNIRLLDPDILGFQELWHGDAILDALAAAGLSDVYDVLSPDEAKGEGIVCAAIVRKGLLAGSPEWIVRFPDKFILQSSGDDPQTPEISVRVSSFSRPVLRFLIKAREDGEPINVYVCHFKSKGPTKVYREPWFKQHDSTYKKHATGLGSALSTIRRTAEAAALRFLLSEQMKGTRAPVVVLGDVNDSQHSNTVNILTEQP
jgi:predicted extracellular nuclease